MQFSRIKRGKTDAAQAWGRMFLFRVTRLTSSVQSIAVIYSLGREQLAARDPKPRPARCEPQKLFGCFWPHQNFLTILNLSIDRGRGPPQAWLTLHVPWFFLVLSPVCPIPFSLESIFFLLPNNKHEQAHLPAALPS